MTLDHMRAAIVTLATLVIAGLIGVATTTFRPASDDVPLEPITVEAPAEVSPVMPAPEDLGPAANLPVPVTRVPVPAQAPSVVPDARSQVPPPPPPPPPPVGANDVPPPPPAVDGDDFDDWAGDDDGGFDDGD